MYKENIEELLKSCGEAFPNLHEKNYELEKLKAKYDKMYKPLNKPVKLRNPLSASLREKFKRNKKSVLKVV